MRYLSIKFQARKTKKQTTIQRYCEGNKSAFLFVTVKNSRSVYLTRTKATGANGNGLRRTVNNCFYLADVRLPGSVGLAMRV